MAAMLAIVGTLIMAAGFFVLSAPTATAANTDNVVVCKFVGTPGVDERFSHIIVVDANALRGDGFAGTFPFEFSDEQGQSVAIGFEGEVTEANCPAPTPPPPADVVLVPAVTFVDNCGTANDSVTAVANAGFTAGTVRNEQNPLVFTTTFTALEGFVLNATVPNPIVTTLTDVACPTNPVIVKTQDQECVGTALVTTFFENGVNVGSETVNGAQACATDDAEVLGESANDNSNNNNGGNNNGGGSPEVLGAQASANNAPAPAVQQSAPAAQVPTVINAGIAGEAPASPLAPAAIALFGALMGLIALGMRGGLARVGGGKA